ncbi:ABC transporter substrate-binding protein [Neptuniibacter sp. QD37_6]|uniref:ABC transporter substrate-binding protein n=1 Tax=Neptuniibacter sp. QD37_6 TaxID=3398210 RepID=UPI0039F49EC0
MMLSLFKLNHLLMFSTHALCIYQRFLFSLLAIMIPYTALAEEPYKVGIASWGGYPESVRGFKDGLAKAGLIENQNLVVVEGKIGANSELQTEVAKNFNNAGLDLVFSLTTPGTAIFKSIISPETPIVFSVVTYPADSGLIESFEYSGNNLVGTSNYVPIRNYLTLLKLIKPDTKTVAIFHRKGEPNSQIQASNMIRLLRKNQITPIDVQVESIEEVKTAAMALVGKADLFMTTTDTLMQSGGEQALIDISLDHSIPILSSNKKGINSGSTFGPVADFYTLGKISGEKAAEILLKGTKPTYLKSELQDPPLFLVNRSSLETLGIRLSEQAAKQVHWVNP